MRIIAGLWRRTPLPVRDEPGLRPTPDRVRETLFNWLAHAFGEWRGRTAVDLFAGSGALGFEAASRGAASIVLVEDNPRIVNTLRETRDKLPAPSVEILAGKAAEVGGTLSRAGRHFDIVFVDPPFGSGLAEAILPLASTLAGPAGMVYVESDRPLAAELVELLHLEIYRADKAGDVFYHLLQRKKIIDVETTC